MPSRGHLDYGAIFDDIKTAAEVATLEVGDDVRVSRGGGHLSEARFKRLIPRTTAPSGSNTRFPLSRPVTK